MPAAYVIAASFDFDDDVEERYRFFRRQMALRWTGLHDIDGDALHRLHLILDARQRHTIRYAIFSLLLFA